MISAGRILLVPAGDQAPAGRRVPGEGGRLVLADGGAVEACWVADDDAELIETAACGTYLRLGRSARIERGGGPAVEVEPGLYQVIRRTA